MTDMLGKVIAIILAFILTILSPFAHIMLATDLQARITIMNEMQSALDEIIDSRQYTKEQKEDINLALAGLGPVLDVDVTRYIRTVNPDPAGGGKVYVSYVLAEDNTVFNEGDKAVIHVKSVGYTGAQRALRATFMVVVPSIDIRFSGRVR